MENLIGSFGLRDPKIHCKNRNQIRSIAMELDALLRAVDTAAFAFRPNASTIDIEGAR